MDIVAKKKESPLKKLKTRKEFLIIGGLLLVIIAVYLIGSLYFNQKFLKNTYINGVDVGGLTVEEANDELAKLVNGYTLELQFNDGNSYYTLYDEVIHLRRFFNNHEIVNLFLVMNVV